MFNKDVVLPGRMRRKIANPRILLLDCPLEYKKGENQTNVEITKEEDWATLLKMEEQWIESVCKMIIAFKPDVVVTEKGLSDLCAHVLAKAGISAIRRSRKVGPRPRPQPCAMSPGTRSLSLFEHRLQQVQRLVTANGHRNRLLRNIRCTWFQQNRSRRRV
jgi:chaperonin GroEL (HSP60 family)